MEKEIASKSEKDTFLLGEQIGRMAFKNMIVCLHGKLGVGKTLFTKGIAKGLGITANVNSPTFTLLKIYHGRLDLYHLDAYRIQDPNADFMLEEYFEAGGVCVIEWAEVLAPLLPEARLDVEIIAAGVKKRKIKIMSFSESYFPIIEALK